MPNWKESSVAVKSAPPSWRDASIPVPKNPDLTPLEQIETASRSALAGATLDISEPIVSGLTAGGQVAADFIMGTGDPDQDKGVIDRLKAKYDADVERRRDLESRAPLLSAGSKIAGAVLPAVFSFGETAPVSAGMIAKTGMGIAKSGAQVAKIGSTAAKSFVEAIPFVKSASAAKGLVGSAARMAVSGAEGAGAVLASEIPRRVVGENTGFIRPEDNEPSLLEAAAGGAKFGAAISAIPEAAKFIKWGGKKLLTSLGGVNQENISRYIADPEAVRKAKTLTEIKDEIDATVGRIRDDVDAGKLSAEQADEAVKVAKSALSEHMAENRQLLREQKFDIAQAKREADAMADNAVKTMLDPIKNVKPPVRMADDVLDAVDDLKQRVVEGSKESYKILDKAKGQADIAGLGDIAGKAQEAMKINGTVVGETSQASFNAIQKFRDKLTELPDKISFRDAKKLVQQLDQDINYINTAGGFSDDASRAVLDVRRALDDRLKEVAGYAEKMQEVAEDSRLLSESRKMFGKREGAVSKLNRIEAPTMEQARETLDRLAQRTGRDFKSPLDEYIKTRALSKDTDALSKMASSLPEVKAQQAAEAELARSRRPDFGAAQMEMAENGSAPALALRQAQAGQTAAQAKLGQAQEVLEPFKRLTPETSQNIIRSVMNEKSIQFKKMLAQLGNLSDKDFVKMIGDLETAQSFNREFRQGSRNVNMWALMGLGLTTAVSTGDPITGLAVMGGAAGFGGLVDKFGPAMTKRILDGVIAIKGMPTLQKIDRAFQSVPPQVREEIKRDLIRAVNIYKQGGPVYIPETQREQTRRDIIDSDLSNTEKAKIVDTLNRTGAVDEGALNRVMVGDQPKSEAASFLEEKAQ